VEIPPVVELAWGLREEPVKGPKRALSIGRIVDAGIELARADGLAALSMGRVAAAVELSPMALYRYVSGKDELIQLMVDAAMGPPPEPVAGEGWRAGLERWTRAMFDGSRANAWAIRVPISGPPALPNGVRWLERGLSCLAGTRLDEGQKLSVILLLTGLVRFNVMLTADLAAVGPSAEEMLSGYGRLLTTLTTPDAFPAVNAVVDAGVFDEGEDDDADWDFTFGLARILDGVATLVGQR
jgi:AcrR family transcriptional regulator